jgi:putative redox protein
MKVRVKQVEGLTLVGQGETEHWTLMDTQKEYGGHQGASKPIEMLLMSLGGCSGMDVISILRKMREPVEDFEIEIDADQKEDHPKTFRQIRMKYKIYGENINSEKVKQAIELSKEKYCSVWSMLKETVPIEYDFDIYPRRS